MLKDLVFIICKSDTITSQEAQHSLFTFLFILFMTYPKITTSFSKHTTLFLQLYSGDIMTFCHTTLFLHHSELFLLFQLYFHNIIIFC